MANIADAGGFGEIIVTPIITDTTAVLTSMGPPLASILEVGATVAIIAVTAAAGVTASLNLRHESAATSCGSGRLLLEAVRQ